MQKLPVILFEMQDKSLADVLQNSFLFKSLISQFSILVLLNLEWLQSPLFCTLICFQKFELLPF